MRINLSNGTFELRHLWRLQLIVLQKKSTTTTTRLSSLFNIRLKSHRYMIRKKTHINLRITVSFLQSAKATPHSQWAASTKRNRTFFSLFLPRIISFWSRTFISQDALFPRLHVYMHPYRILHVRFVTKC